LGEGNSKVFLKKRGGELSPIQRGDNLKNTKIGWGHLKILAKTTGTEKHESNLT
jgi:hypothetical protein